MPHHDIGRAYSALDLVTWSSSRAAPFAIIERTFGAFGAVAVDHIRHIAICPGAPTGRNIIAKGAALEHIRNP